MLGMTIGVADGADDDRARHRRRGGDRGAGPRRRHEPASSSPPATTSRRWRPARATTPPAAGRRAEPVTAWRPERGPRAGVRLRPAVWDPRDRLPVRLVGHPEDDPMEKHDHPTSTAAARRRRSGPRRGRDADPRRRRRDPQDRRRAVRVRAASTRTSTRAPATSAGSRGCTAPTCELRSIRRAWTLSQRAVLHRARAGAAGAGRSCSASSWRRSCSARPIRSARRSPSGTSRSRSSAS